MAFVEPAFTIYWHRFSFFHNFTIYRHKVLSQVVVRSISQVMLRRKLLLGTSCCSAQVAVRHKVLSQVAVRHKLLFAFRHASPSSRAFAPPVDYLGPKLLRLEPCFYVRCLKTTMTQLFLGACFFH